MVAQTRGASGITVPTNHFIPTSEPASRQPAKKTSTAKKPAPKANTSKPRVKKTTAGRVAKPPAQKKATAPKKKAAAPKKAAPKTENHREPTLMDKVQGVAEQIVGVLEGNPAKKVSSALR